jgi:hypothetical protein
MNPCVLVLLLLLNACATIMHGGEEQVAVSSTPPGALIYVDNTKTGTPAMIWLARKSTHTIVISEDGYEDESFTVSRSLSPWLFGNLFLFPPVGTLIGFFVDWGSGGAWELQPDDVHVNMRQRLRETRRPSPPE